MPVVGDSWSIYRKIVSADFCTIMTRSSGTMLLSQSRIDSFFHGVHGVCFVGRTLVSPRGEWRIERFFSVVGIYIYIWYVFVRKMYVLVVFQGAS